VSNLHSIFDAAAAAGTLEPDASASAGQSGGYSERNSGWIGMPALRRRRFAEQAIMGAERGPLPPTNRRVVLRHPHMDLDNLGSAASRRQAGAA
jgi:hypothetical protein